MKLPKRKSSLLPNEQKIIWSENINRPDYFIHEWLSDPKLRKGYISACIKAGEKPRHIKETLEYFGCYK